MHIGKMRLVPDFRVRRRRVGDQVSLLYGHTKLDVDPVADRVWLGCDAQQSVAEIVAAVADSGLCEASEALTLVLAVVAHLESEGLLLREDAVEPARGPQGSGGKSA